MQVGTDFTTLFSSNVFQSAKNSVAPLISDAFTSYISDKVSNVKGLLNLDKLKTALHELARDSKTDADHLLATRTAETALKKSADILQKMHTLAEKASSYELSETDRNALQEEFDELRANLDDIADKTSYGSKQLLNGSMAQEKVITADLPADAEGISSEPESDVMSSFSRLEIKTVPDRKVFHMEDMDAAGLGLGSTALGSAEEALKAAGDIDKASELVSSRIDYLNYVEKQYENKIAGTYGIGKRSQSTGRACDMTSAKNIAAILNRLISTSGQTALDAQANASPQTVLSLVDG